MSATDLWAAVKERYDDQTLRTLTNIRKRANTGIDDAVGTLAAQTIIDLFPVHVQAEYEPTSGTHVEVAVIGVIAMLWKRGGSAAEAQTVKWEEWTAMADGLKAVEPRGHAVPRSNSQLVTDPAGRVYPQLPWAGRSAFYGLMPRPRGPYGPYGGPCEWY